MFLNIAQSKTAAVADLASNRTAARVGLIDTSEEPVSCTVHPPASNAV